MIKQIIYSLLTAQRSSFSLLKQIIYSLLTAQRSRFSLLKQIIYSLLAAQRSSFSLLFVCSMLFAPGSGLQAQTIPPPYINYQAILYDVNGQNPNAPYALQSFPAFVNLNDELGNLLYREEHYSSTDANGQVTIKIGDGLYLAGPITNFNQINWASGKYYLVVEFDINGTISATAPEQLVTVPYAFYAGNSGSGISTITDNGDGTLTFTYNNGTSYTTPVLSGITGPQGPTGPAGQPGAPGPQGQPGPTGADGQNTLVGTSIEPVGANCAEGGVMIQYGLDTNGNGTLDANEINNALTKYICNGAQGTPGSQDAWSLNGNTGTDATANYIGTADNQDLVLKANNAETMRLSGDGKVAIGTQTPDPSAKLEVNANDQGFLPPRLTTAERDAIVNPANGLIIFNISSGCPNYHFGGTWYEWCGTNTLPAATISSLECGAALTVGTLTDGIPAGGVSIAVDYTNGNGGTYNAQSFASTGVAGLVASLASGTLNNGSGSVTYTISGTPASVGTASFNVILAGQACTIDIPVNLPVASVSSLNCAGATTSGTLLQGTPASGVSANVVYADGNGGTYSAQTISSTGVTGLSATLVADTIVTGTGALSFAITGTPSSSGTAVFALTFGGQTCSFSVNVASLTAQYPTGSIFCASGPTAIVEVTNPSTGKTWMDRNLGASQIATSSTDANAYGDLYQWGRRSDGHQCRTSTTISTLSSTDQPAHGNFITTTTSPFDWRSPQNNNLWQGVNGVNNPCPMGYRIPTENELNNERLSWGNNNAAGAFSDVLKWTLGGARSGAGLINSVGSIGVYWSSTLQSLNAIWLRIETSTSLTAGSIRADAVSIRCIKETVATLGALNCGSATTSGNVYSGQATSGVSTTVPYTGGNGGYYAAQSVSSTGVTGLTATIAAGTLANGSGSLTYAISGTASAAGTATFSITIGGQSCSFSVTVATLTSQYPANAVFCTSGATAIVEVTNPTTGKTWMDRNLGASQVATSSTDANAYGDLYQWGRRSDGHQCRTSATTTTLSSTDQPAHGNFILAPNTPSDWRNPQNTNLWQGVNAINNPCPTGYRLPTESELNNERLSWNTNTSSGAFLSTLKLTMSGGRNGSNGSLVLVNSQGVYWTSVVSSIDSRSLQFTNSSASMFSDTRASGITIRCIKEIAGTLGALNCGGATTTGSLFAGQAASGVSSSVPYTGANSGTYSAQSVSSTGVTGLTASLPAGSFANGAGSLTYTITGTPSAAGTASFALNIGGQSCTLTLTVTLPPASITALNCASATTSGILISGQAASGVSSSVPYTGGNGGTYNVQTINSTGVTGLTANLSAGTLGSGSGSVSFTIIGTPAITGTASFALTLGGQSCTLTIPVISALAAQYPAGSVFCASGPTTIVEVTNPATGKTWMDRNLGASQAATSSTDVNAYGDFYQWGRRSDGHQCRTSITTTTLSTTDQPTHGNFILQASNGDWRNPQNNNLWQGANGINNPCPSGFRLPTQIEFNAEASSWGANTTASAFSSPLKFPAAGGRRSATGATIVSVGTGGVYWTSTVSSSTSINKNFGTMDAALIGAQVDRADGNTVRCIKN